MSWLGELTTVCQYRTTTRCVSDAVVNAAPPGEPPWWLCAWHAEHGALTERERAQVAARLR